MADELSLFRELVEEVFRISARNGEPMKVVVSAQAVGGKAEPGVYLVELRTIRSDEVVCKAVAPLFDVAIEVLFSKLPVCLKARGWA